MTKTWHFEHWMETGDNTLRGKNVNTMKPIYHYKYKMEARTST